MSYYASPRTKNVTIVVEKTLESKYQHFYVRYLRLCFVDVLRWSRQFDVMGRTGGNPDNNNNWFLYSAFLV